MGRLSDHEFHILSVVAKHDRICIGLLVSAEWAPIAKTLAQLARPNPGMLIEEQTDNGPAYSLSEAHHQSLNDASTSLPLFYMRALYKELCGWTTTKRLWYKFIQIDH